MLELFNKAQKLKDKFDNYVDCDKKVSEILLHEYPNIPHNIMKYFFVRHSYQGEEIVSGIKCIDARDINVSLVSINNNEISDDSIISNAPFTTYTAPNVEESSRTTWEKYYRYDYFTKGTWDFPIIAIKQDNKYIVVDGTNRFRHMRNCLAYNFDFIKDTHLIYVLNT